MCSCSSPTAEEGREEEVKGGEKGVKRELSIPRASAEGFAASGVVAAQIHTSPLCQFGYLPKEEEEEASIGKRRFFPTPAPPKFLENFSTNAFSAILPHAHSSRRTNKKGEEGGKAGGEAAAAIAATEANTLRKKPSPP
jgi:hypothetical protein